MKSTLSCFFLLAGLGLLASGQTASGPTLGWTPAADGRSLRTIYGVPGAARLGSQIDLASGLRLLSLSPAANTAIAAEGDPAWPVTYEVLSGARTTLEGARSNPAEATWSSAGGAVAIRYPESSWIQVFAASDGRYHLVDEFAAAGPVAISDDGKSALVLSGPGLDLRTSNGTAHLADAPVAAFTFLSGTSTPVFETSAGLTIGDVLIPTPPAGDDPLYLGSPARDRILMLRGSGQATILDSTGRVLADQSCNCEPVGFASIGRAGTLLLRTQSGIGTLWLADASAEARVYFVPPDRTSAVRIGKEKGR